MYTITLNNGTEYAVRWCGVSSGILIAELMDDTMTMTEAATAFSDAEATATITYQYGKMSDVYEGYTQLILVQDQRWQGGGIMMQLRRPDNV